MPNRPLLRHDRDQGRRRRRPRRRAPCCRPASTTSRGTCRSRTKSSSAWRRRQGPGRSSPERRHRIHAAQRRRPLDPRSTASAPIREVAPSDPPRPGGAPGHGPAARPPGDPGVRLRPGRHRDAEHPQQPGPLQQPEQPNEFNVDKANALLDARRLEARRRRHPREERPQDAASSSRRRSTRCGRRRRRSSSRRAPKAGIDLELKAVIAVGLLLVGRRQSRHQSASSGPTCRCSPRTSARPTPTASCSCSCSWECRRRKANKWQGRNIRRAGARRVRPPVPRRRGRARPGQAGRPAASA